MPNKAKAAAAACRSTKSRDCYAGAPPRLLRNELHTRSHFSSYHFYLPLRGERRAAEQC